MKKLFLLILCVLGVQSWTLAAQDADSPYAMPFTAIVRDAAVSGMAGAGSSTGGAFAALRGSAAAAFAGVSAFEAGYQSWAPKGLPSTNINFGGSLLVGHDKGTALTVAVASQSGEAYDVVSTGGAVTGQHTPKDMLLGVGLGTALGEHWSLGGSFKLANQSLSPDTKYSSIALDLAVAYRSGDIRCMAGVSNMLGSVKDAAGTSFSIPSSAFVAGDWTKKSESGSISVAADFDYFLKGGIAAAFGAQYGIKDIVFLRAGYHLGASGAPIPSYASIGAGVRYFGIGLDFAFLTANESLGGGMNIALSYRF